MLNRFFFIQNTSKSSIKRAVTFSVKEWFLDPEDDFTDKEVDPLAYMTVKIDGVEQLTNASGQTIFNLAPGEHTYEVYDMVRYLTTRKGTVTVVDAAVAVDVKIYACLYTPAQVDNLINPPLWEAGTYDQGWQVEHNSVIYQASVETSETPGVGDDWVVSSKYIPVATATELDGLRNATDRRMGQGTVHDTVSDVTTGLDKNYVQVNNIDAENAEILRLTLSGSAVYDGNELLMKNITQNGTGDTKNGLFLVDTNNILKNVRASEISITNTNVSTTGILCAINRGLIENCWVYSDITSTQNQIGGIAGINQSGGKITNSDYIGTITGVDYVGGIVGIIESNSTIELCNVDATIISSGFRTGGITGGSSAVINSLNIKNNQIKVAISGSERQLGGIIGGCFSTSGSIEKNSISGSIESTYTLDARSGGAIGFVTRAIPISNNSCDVNINIPNGRYVGGFIGDATGGAGQSTSITNSYSVGSVTGGADVGGFCGKNTGTITNSYYDSQTSGQSDTGKGLPRTTAQLKNGTADSFINPDGTPDLTEDPANAMFTGWDDLIWDFTDNTKYPELI